MENKVPIDLKQYATELAKNAGVPDDQVQAFINVLGNEKVSKELSDRMLAKDDYSRSMDGITAERRKNADWYANQLKIAEQNQKVVDEANARILAYKEIYGELPDDGTPQRRAANGQYLSKEDFDKAMKEELAKRDGQFIAVTKDAMYCSSDYLKRFNEVLDPTALEEFAVKSGLPLKAAYTEFIKPRVDAATNASWDEKLKAAREEGRIEGSKNKVPTDTEPAEASVFSNYLDKKRAAEAITGTSAKPSSSFLDAWQSYKPATR